MKLTPDIINSAFEAGAGIICWLNVRQILRDKKVSGLYWPTQAFFALFGVWNLYYYPTLGQWCSFAGGAFLVVANTTWTLLAHHYSKKERQQAAIQI